MGIIISNGNGKNFSSRAQSKKSKLIDVELLKDQEKYQKIMKFLLLGPSDCGKSTVLKQMKILNGIGFTEKELQLQKTTIYSNIILSMNKIIQAMEMFKIEFDNPEREIDVNVTLQALKLKYEDLKLSIGLTTALKNLWNDTGVRECYTRGNEYNLGDSTKYFLDNIDRLSDENYVPTDQDILRSRVMTTGIVEVTFKMKNLIIKMFDVGGQRAERRKWIHCFDNVNAVFFLASLSEYNMVLTEDCVTNRMIESLKLFEQLCKTVYFKKSSMILFLNKTDVFAEKIRVHPLTVAFPEYNGPQTYEESVTYTEAKFSENKPQTIYLHRTCATDTKSIEFVFSACLDMIIEKSTASFGLA